jgi:phosphatidate phosphatase APP1
MPESIEKYCVFTLPYGVTRKRLKMLEKLKNVAKMRGFYGVGAYFSRKNALGHEILEKYSGSQWQTYEFLEKYACLCRCWPESLGI